jgi:hypothetical protein
VVVRHRRLTLTLASIVGASLLMVGFARAERSSHPVVVQRFDPFTGTVINGTCTEDQLRQSAATRYTGSMSRPRPHACSAAS